MGADNIYVAHYRKSDCTIQTVKEHLLGTSRIAEKYASKVGMSDWGKLIGLLHDLGKNTELFNRYIKSGVGILNPSDENFLNSVEYKGKIDHASAGAQYIYHQEDMEDIVKSIIALIIKSHHGGLIDCLTPQGENLLHKKMNKENHSTRLDEAKETIDSVIIDEIRSIDGSKLRETFLSNLTKMKESRNAVVTHYELGMLIRYLFSCLIDADRQDTADFEKPRNLQIRNHGTYEEWNELIKKLEDHLLTFSPKNEIDVIRKNVSDVCREFANKSTGIYQLSVPTGGGKTLASLRFALHHAEENKLERIFYIVPFNTIIDQNAETVRQILEKDKEIGSIVLEHHSNLTEEEECDKTKLLSENWDAPIVFTSMVQLLDSIFSGGTRNTRRMHQLAHSVIIFDEIQMLPIRFVYLFNLTIRFFSEVANSSIVLCTATQPGLNKLEEKQYSLQMGNESRMIYDVEELHKKLSRTIVESKVKVEGWTEQEIIDLVMMEKKSGKSVLIIVNTKKSALQLSELLQAQQEAFYHLSTGMCPAHRRKTLNNLILHLEEARKESMNPPICVSTQLIEAGIDIDFDVVIRYLTGLDSIVQAAGRCNRNGRLQEKGKVYLVNAKDENLDKLKDIRIGKEIVERLLYEYQLKPEAFEYDLLSPTSIERYYQYYYFTRQNEMPYPCHIEEFGINNNLIQLLSTNEKAREANRMHFKEPFVLPFSFESASKQYKAIDVYTQGVIVPYEEEGRDIIIKMCSKDFEYNKFELMKKAQQYSVNLFRYQIEDYEKKGVLHEIQKESGIYYIEEAFYDNDYGILRESRKQEVILL